MTYQKSKYFMYVIVALVSPTAQINRNHNLFLDTRRLNIGEDISNVELGK